MRVVKVCFLYNIHQNIFCTETFPSLPFYAMRYIAHSPIQFSACNSIHFNLNERLFYFS